MMRFLGYLFVLLLIVAAALFGGRYYVDRQARTYVAQAVKPIYSNWNFAAMKSRASPRIRDVADFEASGRRLFDAFGGVLGPLQSADAPEGSPEFGWKSDAEVRGLFARYTVNARFERGEARLRFVVAKEGGIWQIIGFRIEGPASLESAVAAFATQGSESSFKPGNAEESAAIAASARKVIESLDAGTAGDCWDNSSPALKQIVSRERFLSDMTAQRAEVGSLKDRNPLAVEFALDLPGRPRGRYARAEFESSFTRGTLEERLLFYHQDGKWLLAGYRWSHRE
jgi:uncharacterized protein DUF4019